jgi:hypothetical protein
MYLCTGVMEAASTKAGHAYRKAGHGYRNAEHGYAKVHHAALVVPTFY